MHGTGLRRRPPSWYHIRPQSPRTAESPFFQPQIPLSDALSRVSVRALDITTACSRVGVSPLPCRCPAPPRTHSVHGQRPFSDPRGADSGRRDPPTILARFARRMSRSGQPAMYVTSQPELDGDATAQGGGGGSPERGKWGRNDPANFCLVWRGPFPLVCMFRSNTVGVHSHIDIVM